MQGFINVNKPSGVTSAYVVAKIKRAFNIKKVGHMGTLDPMACGVLPIAIGKATRMFDYMQQKTKQYIAVFSFGYETDTFDSDGQVVNTTTIIPTEKEVLTSIAKLTGKISQIPPQFSAKKINGKKAYEYARSGEIVELKPKEVEVFEFELLETLENNSFKFKITCSSGTYIRSLARDLAKLTNSLCTMTYLQRTQTGIFDINNSVNFNDIVSGNSSVNDIMSIEKVFSNYEIVEVNKVNFDKIKNGQKVNINFKETQNCFIKHNNTILGVASIENGLIKMKTYLLEE